MKYQHITAWRVICLFILVSIATPLAGCTKIIKYDSLPRVESKNYQFKTLEVERGNVDILVSLDAKVVPAVTVSQGFSLSGIVTDVYARIGAIVKKGDILGKLAPVVDKDAMQNAKWAMERAKVILDAIEKSPAPIDQDALESARQQYQQAREAVDHLKEMEKGGDLISDYDGVIMSANFVTGDQVNANQPVVVIGLEKDLLFRIDNVISTIGGYKGYPVEFNALRLGASLIAPEIPDYPFATAYVVYEPNCMNPDIPSNYYDGYKDSVFVKFSAPEGYYKINDSLKLKSIVRRAENVIRIPRYLVQKEPNQPPFVYVQEQGAKIRRYLSLGICDVQWYEVRSGLVEGDLLIVQ